MKNFNVPDMSCGHCTATIEKAIRAIDPSATVSCDLETHTVCVNSSLGDQVLSEAIRSAGFETPS